MFPQKYTLCQHSLESSLEKMTSEQGHEKMTSEQGHKTGTPHCP